MSTFANRVDFQAQMVVLLADNTNEDITALDLQQVSTDLSDSVAFKGGAETISGIWTFTAVAKGITPVADEDFVIKSYVDSLIQGLDWQESVIDRYDPTSATPASPSTGDRYISTATGNGWTDKYVYEWDGSAWDETIPTEGYATWVEDEDVQYVYNGTTWATFGSTTTHNNTSGLQGGTSGEYYHLTAAEYAALASYSVSNESNNRILTSVSAGQGNAEANLTFDGTTFQCLGADIELSNSLQLIRMNTSDGADNKLLSLNGGGATGSARGASVSMYGNEYGSGLGGDLILGSGDFSTSKITVSSNGSEGVEFNQAGTPTLAIDSSGDIDFNGGALAGIGNMTSDGSTTWTTNTSDAADNAVIVIAGGGANLASRGAIIGIYGNEYTGGIGGRLLLAAGDDPEGDILFNTNGTTNAKLAYDGEFTIENELKVGGGGTATSPIEAYLSATTGTSMSIIALTTAQGGGLRIRVDDASLANPVWQYNTFASEDQEFLIANVSKLLITPSTTTISTDLSIQGKLNISSDSQITISSGAVTITQSYHNIDTEADASTDDLDTINGGVEGDRLVVVAHNSGRTVVMKDGTGNLQLNGDFSLTSTQDTMELIFNGTNWLELSRSDNG